MLTTVLWLLCCVCGVCDTDKGPESEVLLAAHLCCGMVSNSS